MSGAARCTPGVLGLGPGLDRAGFNLAGVLAAERYDALAPAGWRSSALLPGARAVVVLGCGGRAFGDAFTAADGGREPGDPVDRFTVRVVRRAAAHLAAGGAAVRPGFYWERRGGEYVDLVGLGRACGLGAPGRLGLLLHPVYGPWLSLRALLLTTAALPATPPLPGFDPCRGCPAPCADACPGAAVRPDAFDAVACARASAEHPPCRQRCAARRACVLGRDHAYRPDLERRHRAAALARR